MFFPLNIATKCKHDINILFGWWIIYLADKNLLHILWEFATDIITLRNWFLVQGQEFNVIATQIDK